MFTGIVEELGQVTAIEKHSAGARISISCSSVLADTVVGASIAVNGVCLTAVEIKDTVWRADLAPETLGRTNLGDLQPGSLVNLERPLRFNGRLDGHFVLGHVDGTAEIASLEPLGDGNWWLAIEVPAELARYIVSKGSVAVDGTSLTVAGISGTRVVFAVIPHTFEHTAFKARTTGSRVNLEVDILAKHLERLTCR